MGLNVLASTEEKALLRYLYLREEYLNEEHQHLDEVLIELTEFDKKHNYDYGFSYYCNPRNIWAAIGTLEDLVLARYESNSGHIALTMTGRCYGNEIEFAGKLEEDLRETFKKWSRRDDAER